MRSPLNIDVQSFSQFVFDNADFNTQTLDGHNTFHAIGAKVVGSFGAIELKTFTKKNDTGLKTIKIQNLGSIRAVSEVIILSVSDLLWLYGKWVDLPNIPGWNGFMEQATAELPYENIIAKESEKELENFLAYELAPFPLYLFNDAVVVIPHQHFIKEKLNLLKYSEKNPDLNEVIEVFKNPNADPEVIAKAGERFLIELYSYSDVKERKSTSINNYRYACFTASAHKINFSIASLPPTEAAAQHSFRTYHQVQQWYGNEQNVEQWGWKKDKNGLIPVTTFEPSAPENSSEEEKTDTNLEQINHEIENDEDRDETDDPIADDAEETFVFDIIISTEDDENTTSGPSTRMKRRRLN
ncbi:hypothetical protein EVAR_15016_1 [Eumeta japonica]|uniref:Uncharacterized protein n=1 Tax=Eumeta variegata TaxID=151549 RepID=A0A4C1X9T0_EUMVA|nr:hypothetical protein EVAR_15016_1 [Eumeta japonica]